MLLYENTERWLNSILICGMFLFPYLLKTFMRWVSWLSGLLRPLPSFMFTPKPAGHWMSIELDFFSIPQRSDLTFRWIILQRGLSINQQILGLSWILKLPQQRYLLCPICGNLTLACLCYCCLWMYCSELWFLKFATFGRGHITLSDICLAAILLVITKRKSTLISIQWIFQ